MKIFTFSGWRCCYINLHVRSTKYMAVQGYRRSLSGRLSASERVVWRWGGQRSARVHQGAPVSATSRPVHWSTSSTRGGTLDVSRMTPTWRHGNKSRRSLTVSLRFTHTKSQSLVITAAFSRPSYIIGHCPSEHISRSFITPKAAWTQAKYTNNNFKI